jgi:hypothetical protein
MERRLHEKSELATPHPNNTIILGRNGNLTRCPNKNLDSPEWFKVGCVGGMYHNILMAF